MVTLRLEPMTDRQYLRYRERAEESYAQDICDSGAMPLPEARRKAQEDYGKLLPDGLSVFGFNLPARTLYEQMGFEVTALQMRKRL